MAQFHNPHGLEFQLILESPRMTQSIDLQYVVAEINMYEDLFESFMKVEIALNDALGIIDKFPVVGDETLTFNYQLLTKKVYTQKFKLYRISHRSLAKARQHTVVLHGITEPGYKNSLESIYKPYIQKKPHEIVNDICDQYLDIPTGASLDQGPVTAKTLAVPVKTVNTYTRVSSGQNPLQLINMICNESKSEKAKDYKNPSNYVFYEDNLKFNFLPINFLLEKNIAGDFKNFFLGIPKNTDQFEKAEKPTYGAEDEAYFKGITSFKFVDEFDNLDSIHRGSYQNEVNIIDPILKRFRMHPIPEPDKKKHQFEYVRDFDDLTHMPNSGEKFILPEGDVGKATKPYAAHRRMMITQYELDDEKYPTIGYLDGKLSAGDQLLDPRQRHKNLPESLHEKNNLMTHVVEITVPGNPDLTVGEQIIIQVPQPTLYESEAVRFLELYGQQATFLVTAVRHLYRSQDESYSMVLSCSAETYGKDPKGMKVI